MWGALTANRGLNNRGDAETHDLDENTLLDLDRNGNIAGITVEDANQRADIPKFSYEQVAA
jgi:uncharacterized protein YuzE